MAGLTPLAQLDIPYEQLLQAQLGTLVAVSFIVLLAVIGLTVITVGVPLMKLLNRMADRTQAAQEKAETALAQTTLAQTRLEQAGGALTSALVANTSELKTQTALLVALGDRVEASGKATTTAITARLDAHDQQAREGIARIEATLAGLRDDILSGHKAQRAEVLGKLNELLTEIRALRPPPLPPLPTPALALVPDKAAEDGEEQAA